MMENSEKIKEDAKKWIRKNHKAIIKKFAGDDIFPKEQEPFSIFMAGSPGAGKTETAKRINEKIENVNGHKVVHVDADEIRSTIPGYKGGDAHLFQGAATIGVDKVHDYVLNKNKSFILDTTFSSYDKARSNIKRSLKRNRKVSIIYVYQDPLVAWEFTQIREEVEGRRIKKDVFIDEFFAAVESVNQAKRDFADDIRVDIIKKNYQDDSVFVEEEKTDVDNIEQYVTFEYNKKELKNIIHD